MTPPSLRPLTLVLLLFLFALPAPVFALELGGTVGRVHDGDTLTVRGVGKVRLLGIDTPEGEDSPRDRFFRRWEIPPKRLRQAAREARTLSARAVEGKRVRLQLESERRDRHGRLLAYVFLPDGRLLNLLLIEEGYAVVYRRFDFGRKAEFLLAEEKSRRTRRGLWDSRD